MPKGRKKADAGGADMDFVDDDDDDDPTVLPPAPAPAPAGSAKFTTSEEREDGSWQPSGELRKKKGGKNWKKRWCHLVRAAPQRFSLSRIYIAILFTLLSCRTLAGRNTILVRCGQEVSSARRTGSQVVRSKGS